MDKQAKTNLDFKNIFSETLNSLTLIVMQLILHLIKLMTLLDFSLFSP